ncbi:MAG: hypothetical protein ACYTKD_27225 [Planctomycetota bacterium]
MIDPDGARRFRSEEGGAPRGRIAKYVVADYRRALAWLGACSFVLAVVNLLVLALVRRGAPVKGSEAMALPSDPPDGSDEAAPTEGEGRARE